LALVALMAVSLGGCSQKASVSGGWEAVELPGFSVELPLGRVEKSTKLTSAGSHHVTLMPPGARTRPPSLRRFGKASAGTLSLHWRAGTMSADDRKQVNEALVRGTAGAIGWRVESLQEEQGRWIAIIGKGEHRMAILGVYCEPGLSVSANFLPAELAGF